MDSYLPQRAVTRAALALLGCLVLPLVALRAPQAQEFAWAKQLGGTATAGQLAISVAADDDGNILTVGSFSGTTDFDPGPGMFNITSFLNGSDVFVSKLDSAGNFVWARQLGGPSIDAVSDGAVDASGNVYTVGVFLGTMDFDPGPGTFNLTSAGQYDVFVSKLDSAGNFVWARRIGGTQSDFAQGVAVDASGNVYTAGYFSDTGDFDPGPGTFNLTSAGQDDIFASKLDSAGNFVWARQLGGSAFDHGHGVVVDASGNVYIVGYFYDTVDFDPGPGTFNLTSAGQDDIFASKLDSAGNFVWARQLGGPGPDQAQRVAVDASGNVHTVGYFLGVSDFDPGSGTFTLTASDYDAFVSKLDSAGNFVWARQLGGGGGTERAYGVAVDAGGNVHTVGTFPGTTDFDPGPGTFNLTSGGQNDTFVSKLDGAGNFAWAGQLGGNADDEARGMTVDATGNVHTVGHFQGMADFDPGPGIFNLTSTGGSDAFISKLWVTLPTAAGAVPDGGLVPGAPLTVAKDGDTLLVLDWDFSCHAGDVDYEVYEGAIANFTSHVPIVCSTGGATNAIIALSDGNRYYLVVPTNGIVEGSYGRDSSGLERPSSSSFCAPQSIGGCR